MISTKIDFNNLQINNEVSVIGQNNRYLFKGLDSDGLCLLRHPFSNVTKRAKMQDLTVPIKMLMFTKENIEKLDNNRCIYRISFTPKSSRTQRCSPRHYAYIGFTKGFKNRMKNHQSNRFDKFSLKHSFNLDEYEKRFMKIINLPDSLPTDDCKIIETWCVLKCDTRVVNSQIMDNHKMLKKDDLFYCLHYFDNVTDVVDYFVKLNS